MKARDLAGIPLLITLCAMLLASCGSGVSASRPTATQASSRPTEALQYSPEPTSVRASSATPTVAASSTPGSQMKTIPTATLVAATLLELGQQEQLR